MSLSGHQSARMKNDEWLTPPEILRALGPFDLDPCAPIARPWETAAAHYTEEDDGLSKPWAGRVWCNPPFGREAVKWLRRMRDHGNGVALIPARTETVMFYECVWGAADGVLFLKGRPHFHYVDGRRAAFNSSTTLHDTYEWGGIAEIVHIAPGRHIGFPVGFAVGAVHYKRGYSGGIVYRHGF